MRSNLHLIAADIARRIPEMAKDSPVNNAAVIEQLLRDLANEDMLLHSILRSDLAVVLGVSLPERSRLGNNLLRDGVYELKEKLAAAYAPRPMTDE